MSKFSAIIAASRPKTLPAAVVPVAIAVALTQFRTQNVGWDLAIWTLLATLFIQLATNYFNDIIDAKKGADTDDRLGPTRAAASGLLSTRFVWGLAFGALGIAALLGIPLILERGWIILAIGIPAAYLCYGYTGGPFPLAYRAMGEIFVLLWFGVIAVTGSYFVQTGEWSLDALVLGFQSGAYSTVLIAINNLRDIETDKLVAKNTIMVLFGKSFGRVFISLTCLLPDLAGIYWSEDGLWMWLAPLIVTLPLKLLILKGVFTTEPSAAYNKFLAVSAVQLLLFGATWTITSMLAG